jgi:hypothetical protein
MQSLTIQQQVKMVEEVEVRKVRGRGRRQVIIIIIKAGRRAPACI